MKDYYTKQFDKVKLYEDIEESFEKYGCWRHETRSSIVTREVRDAIAENKSIVSQLTRPMTWTGSPQNGYLIVLTVRPRFKQ